MTLYTNLRDVNELQTNIMMFVDYWAKEEKTPIPQKAIVEKMKEGGIKAAATVYALKHLLKKKYLRRAYKVSNKTYYVQLRRV